ncbi:hypothetical protein H4R19_001052, partial [Coemansia spiralis]
MGLKPDVSVLSASGGSADKPNGVGEASSKARLPLQGSVSHNKQVAGGCGHAQDMVTTADPGATLRDSSTVASSRELLGDNDLLPATLTPMHYAIHLHPNLDSGAVAGSVAIDARVNCRTRTIVLHAKAIAIGAVAVYAAHDQPPAAPLATSCSVAYDAALETAAIRLADAIGGSGGPVAVRIHISFVAQLSSGMYGLYRCKYRDRAGQPGHMLVTQFQAKCARLVFPCWDEPAIKAEFTLALTVPASHTALSNMPVQRTTVLGDLQTVTFERSPRMSTYLLALASGELSYIEAVAQAGAGRAPVVCRVYTAPADIDKVQFSLDTAVRVLERLVELFGNAYPLPKLDLVAVPELEAGGMENWGLVFFRTVRLYITEQTSLWIRQKAVYVIAHELSHQWFGNLVTMAWWDDLWLNEGFATWIGIYITDQLYPEWNRWDNFSIEDRQAALSADSLKSSHPIHVQIKGSADIDQVFDSITYYKGCSLIRMLSAHLGIGVFMAGVRAYLVAHEYSTATTHDLWQALERVSGQDVGRMMQCWTAHAGYPVVAVDDNMDAGTVQLVQHRYLHSGRPTADEDAVVWWVPLGLVSSCTGGAADGVVRTILHERSGTFAIPGGADARWFKLNHDNTGLYRVCYSRA